MALNRYIPVLTDATAYQAFQLIRIATVLLIGIMLVKAGLNKEEVSGFELFVFWGNLVSFFWVMGIKNAVISYYPKLEPAEKASFFFNVFLLLQMIGLVISIVLLNVYFFHALPDHELSELTVLFPLYVLFYAPTVLIEVIFILRKRAKSMLKYGIYIHLLQFLAIGTVLIFSLDLLYLFLALTIWMLVKWIYTIILVIVNSKWQFSGMMIKTFSLFSLPLILHILLGNGMEYINGVLVSRFFNTDQFAVFRFGARELPVFLVMIGALSSVLIPVAVKNLPEATERIRKESNRLMHLFFPMILILLFISPALYQFFYSGSYITSAFIFNIYMMIFVSRIIMVEVVVYAKHQNHVLMWVSAMELLINLSLSLWLLQWYGLAGIAWATVIAFAASKTFFILFVHKKFRIPITEYLNVKNYLIYTVALFIAHFVSWYLWTK